MRQGENISVYLPYDFIKTLEDYAKKHNIMNKFGKPNRSNALKLLAEESLSKVSCEGPEKKSEKNVQSIIEKHNAKRGKS